MRKIIKLMFVLFIIISAIFNQKINANDIDINRKYPSEINYISIDPNYADVGVGETNQLFCNFYPDDTTDDKTIIWKSDDESIVTVDENGIITGKSLGFTTVTATTVNGIVAKATITVKEPIVSLSFEQESYTFEGTNSRFIRVKTNPENAARKGDIKYTVSDPMVAYTNSTGTNANITPKDAGTVIVTAIAPNGVKTSCTVTFDIPLYRFYLLSEHDTNKNVGLAIGETKTINLITYPKNPSGDSTITWASTNPNIASIDENGVVTALTEGKTEIKAISANGIEPSNTLYITVHPFSYRIYGETRYETSFKAAKYYKELLEIDKFNTVVVVTGENYPDALTGSYLANKYNAPILMTNNKRLNEVVTYIKENVVDNGVVYILGGENALSKDLDSKLHNYKVKRIAGKTRYETNLSILEEAGVTNEDILISTGNAFGDSLSASSSGRPILLVDKELSNEQKEFINDHLNNQYYILGGVQAVSFNLETELKQIVNITRLSGKNRIGTSVNIANTFFTEATHAVIVRAYAFPDGLSAAPIAYFLNAPILLDDGNYSNTATYCKDKMINKGLVFGGETYISNNRVAYHFGVTEKCILNYK